jgi:ABC-2 type transport system ATP-binding protein
VTTTIVQAKDLSKWYGEVIGLNNFNIEVGSGITGMVGPNGSGKSTFFKLVTGTIHSNSGSLLVLGERPWKNPDQLSRIGFCPDYDFLPADLSGRDFLRFAGGLHGMKGTSLAGRIDEVLQVVDMKGAADRKMGGYSKGMRQRMKIAGSFLNDPDLLLLDEPLTGTDPVVRRDIIELIKTLNKDHGHDIIVSSHVLHEIERMTHQVALIYKGRAVASGDIAEIRRLMSDHPHNIVLEGKGMLRLAQSLLEKDFTVSLELSQDRNVLNIRVSRPDDFFDLIPSLVKDCGCVLERMESMDDDLESVFKYLVRW